MNDYERLIRWIKGFFMGFAIGCIVIMRFTVPDKDEVRKIVREELDRKPAQ